MNRILRSARLCRRLRDEVTEQLALGSEALTGLAREWRKLLFPEANDVEFANGYAQAVTFDHAPNQVDCANHRGGASIPDEATTLQARFSGLRRSAFDNWNRLT